MENDSEYYIKNPKQIQSHLSQLFKKNCLISAHFGEKNDSFITTILEIDFKNNLLVLDYGPKEYLNKQLLKAPKPEFRAEFEGIKVAFNGEKINKTRNNGQVVFTMPIPSMIFWMQRRKYYRVKTPLSHDSYCEIIFHNEEENTEQTVRLKLLDISISGFSILNDQLELSSELIPTSVFENCLLHLTNEGSETISFAVKNKFNLRSDKPEKGQRIGCVFTKMTSACESHIQRYMQNIERELRNVL